MFDQLRSMTNGSIKEYSRSMPPNETQTGHQQHPRVKVERKSFNGRTRTVLHVSSGLTTKNRRLTENNTAKTNVDIHTVRGFSGNLLSNYLAV